MPYITQEDRQQLLSRVPANAGELNYVITTVVRAYISQGANDGSYNFNYQKLNDVIGALEGCKLEFYRRVVAPYEEQKAEINGDVY